MKYVNVTMLSADDSVTETSLPIDSSQLISASFHAYFGDATAAGALKIQASNDLCPVGYQPANFTPTHWVDIPNATATIVSGAPALILIPQLSFRWMRIVYTPSGGGSTTITVEMFAVSI